MISTSHHQNNANLGGQPHQLTSPAAVAAEGMMNDGRTHTAQHHHQNPPNSSPCKHQHWCCFGFQQYQDHRHQSHQQQQQHATNLAYYQQQQQQPQPQQQQHYVQQQHHQWYNNNEYDSSYASYESNWTNSVTSEASTTAAAATWTASKSTNSQQQQQHSSTSPMWTSSEPQYNDFYSSYPTPPTPAGSSGGCSSEHPSSIPSDHYPPTPYSVDLSSPNSDSSTSVGYPNNTMGYGGGSNSSSHSGGLEDDIPLHDLIGAAVEASDLLESCCVEKARPTSSGSSQAPPPPSCSPLHQEHHHQHQQQQQQQVAEIAAPASSVVLVSSTGTAAASSSAAASSTALLSLAEPAEQHEAHSGVVAAVVPPPAKKPTKRKKPLYDSKQLQRCLDQACDDWLNDSVATPGYPLHTLSAVKRFKLSSPSSQKPEFNNNSKQIKLSWNNSSPAHHTTLLSQGRRTYTPSCRTPSPPPLASPASNFEDNEVMPCLESFSDSSSSSSSLKEEEISEVKTIRLTFDRCDEKHRRLQHADHVTQTNQPQKINNSASSNVAGGLSSLYTYSCSTCHESWPLTQTQSIAEHLCLLRNNGTAPLTKSIRTVFSHFFNHWSYKIRLLVNPKSHTVSSKTVLSCNHCPKDFAIEATNEDLAADIHDHLVSKHPGQAPQHSDLDQFCYFCDRRVHDMSRHLDEYFSIHHSRLLALATCCHRKKVTSSKRYTGQDDHPMNEDGDNAQHPIWDEDDDDELIESECKQCGQLYTPDQRLPDWMSRASCQNCLIWSSDNAGAKHKVVHCHYCRQGKYGWVKCSKNRSISICLNCVDRTKAYIKMSQESHVQTYVKGMLNELLKQLCEGEQGEKEAVTAKTPEKQQIFEPTFSLRSLLETSVLNCKIPGKLKKFQAFSLSNMKTITAVSNNNALNGPGGLLDLSKPDPSLVFQCSICAQSITEWPQIIQHIVQHSGTFAKHLSKMLDQSLVMLTTDQEITSVTNVLKCRKCKFYLPNSDLNQVWKHIKECSEISKLARVSAPSTSMPGNNSENAACVLCNSHTHSVPSESNCIKVLKSSLALNCNKITTTNQSKCLECSNMAVTKQTTTPQQLDDNNKIYFPFCNLHFSSHEKFVKLMKCFSTITHAFHQSDDSIEEIIVASKQQHKRHFNR